MSILIKGMDMPIGCASCDLCNVFTDEPYCRRLFHKTPKGAARLENCPLVPVPPHGRLIDADEAVKLLNGLGNRQHRREKGTICDALKMLSSECYTPTIVEAEEGK